jgi:hypothetical protein
MEMVAVMSGDSCPSGVKPTVKTPVKTPVKTAAPVKPTSFSKAARLQIMKQQLRKREREKAR